MRNSMQPGYHCKLCWCNLHEMISMSITNAEFMYDYQCVIQWNRLLLQTLLMQFVWDDIGVNYQCRIHVSLPMRNSMEPGYHFKLCWCNLYEMISMSITNAEFMYYYQCVIQWNMLPLQTLLMQLAWNYIDVNY